MATNLIHFVDSGQAAWGVVRADGVAKLRGFYPTTASLIETGEADWRTAATAPATLPLQNLTLLSPVTKPCRVICQGANYRKHMIESGLDPDAKTFNMFFEKSDASIAPPIGRVVRPPHVALLDYEIELGLVMHRQVDGDMRVTAENLPDFVFGLVIGNDISARDVQLPQSQFFKGKSYRGFCPLGPHLTVLEPEDFALLASLELTLRVNGSIRQQDSTANLVFKPAETLTELSTFSDLSPGDVVLTGTPHGCALRAPPPAIRRLLQLLPERLFWRLFVSTQRKRSAYLQPGDEMTLTIRSSDGTIDLGQQRTRVSR